MIAAVSRGWGVAEQRRSSRSAQQRQRAVEQGGDITAWMNMPKEICARRSLPWVSGEMSNVL